MSMLEVALAGLLVLAACNVGADPDRAEDAADTVDADDPAATATTDPARSVDVFDLAVGMCIDGIAEASGRVARFDVVNCRVAHDGEVFSLFDIEAADGAEFPGSAAIEDAAASGCEKRFVDYVGIPFQESRFQATYVAPSEATWADGDREVVCFAYVANGELRRSIEGARE